MQGGCIEIDRVSPQLLPDSDQICLIFRRAMDISYQTVRRYFHTLGCPVQRKMLGLFSLRHLMPSLPPGEPKESFSKSAEPTWFRLVLGRCGSGGTGSFDLVLKTVEEPIRHLSGETVYDPAAKPGQFAANFRLDAIGNLGAAVFGRESYGSTAFAEADRPTFPFALNPHRVRFFGLRKPYGSFDGGFDRSDFLHHDQIEPCFRRAGELLAAGDAGHQYLGVVEAIPDLRPRRCNHSGIMNFHSASPSASLAR